MEFTLNEVNVFAMTNSTPCPARTSQRSCLFKRCYLGPCFRALH